MTSPVMTTPERLITDAMLDAGRLGEGGTPNSEQFAMYTRKLTDIINFEQTNGLKIWTQEELEIPLVASQRDYIIAPGEAIDMTKPLRAPTGYYEDENEVRRPISAISRYDWMQLSTITEEGPISQYFVQKNRADLTISFWLTPDTQAATGAVFLLIQRQVTNFTNLYEEIDFPLEWCMFLRWSLADEIATGQPQNIMDRCQARAEYYRQALEGWDVEDTPTQFTPDPMHNMGSRFR